MNIDEKLELIEKVKSHNIKITPEDVLGIWKSPIMNTSHNIIWIEKGNEKAGFTHIQKQHLQDFTACGIKEDEIIQLIKEATIQNEVVYYQKTTNRKVGRPVYQLLFNGVKTRIAIQIGNNGFVVSANPSSESTIIAEPGDNYVNIILMPDYDCWPLWVFKQDGLYNLNLNQNEFIKNKELTSKIIEWSNKITSDYNPEDPINPLHKTSKKDQISNEINGISLASKLYNYLNSKKFNKSNIKYNVNFHSTILGKRSVDLKDLKETLENFGKSITLNKKNDSFYVYTWAGDNKTQLSFKNLSNDSNGNINIKYKAELIQSVVVDIDKGNTINHEGNWYDTQSIVVNIDKGNTVNYEGDWHGIIINVVNIGETSVEVISS